MDKNDTNQMSDQQFMEWFNAQQRYNVKLTPDEWARYLSIETCPNCKQVKKASAIVECRACLLETKHE